MGDLRLLRGPWALIASGGASLGRVGRDSAEETRQDDDVCDDDGDCDLGVSVVMVSNTYNRRKYRRTYAHIWFCMIM